MVSWFGNGGSGEEDEGSSSDNVEVVHDSHLF